MLLRTEAFQTGIDRRKINRRQSEHKMNTIKKVPRHRLVCRGNGMHWQNVRYARIFILYNFSLKPSSSVSTAENADNTTTFVILYRNGFADSPEILNGLSSSWKQHQLPLSA